MLQQTQADRVVGPYGRFVERFPTPAACAAAEPADVVRAWAGLGYNRRAVFLHRTAAAVVERHGGALPDDLASLLALPGIGAYTARAVLVFAFEVDVGVVDTNVARLLARAVAGRPLRRGRGAVAGRPARAARPVLGVRPVPLRPRRSALHVTAAGLHRLPGPDALRLGDPGLVAPGPRHRLGGDVEAAVAVRGLRPSGPRSAGRGVAATLGRPGRRAGRRRLAGRSRAGRSGRRHARHRRPRPLARRRPRARLTPCHLPANRRGSGGCAR